MQVLNKTFNRSEKGERHFALTLSTDDVLLTIAVSDRYEGDIDLASAVADLVPDVRKEIIKFIDENV